MNEKKFHHRGDPDDGAERKLAGLRNDFDAALHQFSKTGDYRALVRKYNVEEFSERVLKAAAEPKW